MDLAQRQVMFADHPPSGLSSHGQTELGVAIFFLIFCTLIVAMRFWSRQIKQVGYGWDDWLILAALPVYYCEMALQLYAVLAGGLGYHTNQVTAQQEQNLYLQLTVVQFPYAVLFLLVRLSICFLFLRIFPVPWLHKTIYSLMGLAVLWTIFVIVTALTVCIPFEYNWNTSIQGHCNNAAKKGSYLANAIWTILIDAIIWVLPQFSVWGLQMPLMQKATISAVFALGIFDIVVSIIRAYEVQQVNFNDFTFAVYGAQTWTVVEISVALIIACAPMCRPALQRLFPRRIFASFTNADSIGSSNSTNHKSYARNNSLPFDRQTIGGSGAAVRPGLYADLYEPHGWAVLSGGRNPQETVITSSSSSAMQRLDDLEMNSITVQRETIVTTK